MAAHLGAWLSSEGPESDVVVSCRVRLARNVDGVRFVPKLSAEEALKLAERLRPVLAEARLDGETRWVDVASASPLLRLLLLERNLASRDLVRPEVLDPLLPGRAVAFGASETVSVMINEEDHLRVQALAAGFDLDLAWDRARNLDRYIEDRVPFAVTPRLGYLTGCPTNVGTGLRASAMLHLPALGLVRRELEKVFAAAQRTGLAVRGMHGEGSRAAGDLYQISNQITLGRSEAQLIEDLRALVPLIVDFERKLRATLVEEMRAALTDRVTSSVAALRTARSMPTDDALAHLSNVRLGVQLGLTTAAPIGLLNVLGVQVQKGHLQVLTAKSGDVALLETSERDKLRAAYLRQRLG
ncbi:MAG: ATP--guanido phosphotransferase [Planctomycetota bacterium]